MSNRVFTCKINNKECYDIRVMKTLCLTILLLCCGIIATAQNKYEVTTNTFLNIRSYASTDAPVLGTIDNGGEVYVCEIVDGWAKITYGGGYAYVSSDYITKVVDSVPVSAQKSGGFDLSSFCIGKGDAKWLVYIITVLSILLFIVRKKRNDTPLEDGLHVFNVILFLSVAVIELVYLSFMGSDAVWFCIPDKVGWLWTIVDFIIFGIIVYNQFMCFFDTLADVEYNSYGSFDKRWGIYSWTWGIVIGVISGIFFPAALPFVGIAFAVCQLVQLVLIFKGVVPQGGWGHAFLCLAVYLLGSLSTVLILAHFVVLLLIVVVGYFILRLIGNASSSSSRGCCRSCSHYGSNYCSYHSINIYEPDNKTCDYYR